MVVLRNSYLPVTLEVLPRLIQSQFAADMAPNRLQAAGLARAPHETGGVGGNVDPAHRRIKNVGSSRSSAVAVQPRDGIAVGNRIVLVFGAVDLHENRDVADRKSTRLNSSHVAIAY